MARAEQLRQQYFPILKWKAGEQQAVQQLNQKLRSKILPIAEIQDRPFDWTEESFSRSWKEHIDIVAKLTSKSWGTSHEIAIDQSITEDDHIEGHGDAWSCLFKSLWTTGVKAIPVVSSFASIAEIEALASLNKNNRHSALRDRFVLRYELDKPEDAHILSIFHWFQSTLNALSTRYSSVDAVIDFGHIGGDYRPNPAKVAGALEALRLQGPWRSVVFAAGAFPENLAGLSPGVHMLPRNEWHLYKEATLLMRSKEIAYSDYGVNYTEPFTGNIRAVRLSANLRYTYEDNWLVFKAQSSKEHPYKQYQELCRFLVNENPLFMGKDFSFGDKHLFSVACGETTGGSALTWRRDAMNHHIHVVLSQLEDLLQQKT